MNNLSKNVTDVLSRDDLLVVLTYAPAGLGHLRVADALKEGLPDEVEPVLLGSHDTGIMGIHRFMSIHPAMRGLMEWVQRGKAEDLFTIVYRTFLRMPRRRLYEQMLTVLEQRVDEPKKIVVVATHFGLAHQLAAIRNRLEEKIRKELILVVIVTDDSPQHMWCVPGADITFVPSYKTKEALEEYAKDTGVKDPNIKVCAYPVSPKWSTPLSKLSRLSKRFQVSRESEEPINIVMPISGAAVGLDFYEQLIDELSLLSRRFAPNIVVKSAIHTQIFLNEMIKRQQVHLHVASTDREVVNTYERALMEKVVAFEVTKPSEQAFKALVDPKNKGGVILLFSNPVGRQEYDNLDFLRRHNLIPKISEQKFLWELSLAGGSLKNTKEGLKILEKAHGWRGVRLPMGTKKAARFIWWCQCEGVFAKMLAYRHTCVEQWREQEVRADGVVQIWSAVAEMVGGE